MFSLFLFDLSLEMLEEFVVGEAGLGSIVYEQGGEVESTLGVVLHNPAHTKHN
jgi:hypothetical protein